MHIEAARCAAREVTARLKSQNWPSEWFERYPPRAAVEVGDQYTMLASPDAELGDFALMIARLVQHVSTQLAIRGGRDCQSVQGQLLQHILVRLGPGGEPEARRGV